jgi:hypothetical protein
MGRSQHFDYGRTEALVAQHPGNDWESPGTDLSGAMARPLSPKYPDSSMHSTLSWSGETKRGNAQYSATVAKRGAQGRVQTARTRLIPDQATANRQPKHRWN